MPDLIDMYFNDADFRNYVDAYAEKYNVGKSIPKIEAIQHQVVADVAEYYQEVKNNGEEKRNGNCDDSKNYSDYDEVVSGKQDS